MEKHLIETTIKIPIPTYRTYLTLHISDSESLASYHNQIGKKFGWDEDLDLLGARGRAYDVYINREQFREATILLDQEKITHGVIAHELYHAVHFILKYVDIPYTPVTEEAYTCLLEYLTESVYMKLEEEDIAALKVEP